jgi:hypothetical protein
MFTLVWLRIARGLASMSLFDGSMTGIRIRVTNILLYNGDPIMYLILLAEPSSNIWLRASHF